MMIFLFIFVEHLKAFDFCQFIPQHRLIVTLFLDHCKDHFPSNSTLFEKIFNQRGDQRSPLACMLWIDNASPLCLCVCLCVCWEEERDQTHSSSSLKTAYLLKAVSFSSPVTYLPARLVEREIFPSVLEPDPD